jgi:hypothetical protein
MLDIIAITALRDSRRRLSLPGVLPNRLPPGAGATRQEETQGIVIVRYYCY